jgi:hypothetical protein
LLDFVSKIAHNITLMKLFKLLLIPFVFLVISLLAPKKLYASEGTVKLSGSRDRVCLVTSVEATPGRFNLLIRCSNLIYPPPEGGRFYVVWTKEGNGEMNNIGSLDLGRADLNSSSAFSEIVVTTEERESTTSPSQNTVMSGQVKPFSFDVSQEKEQNSFFSTREDTLSPSRAPQPTSTPTPRPSILKGATNVLIRIGAIILVLAAIAGALLYIIRR